MKSKYPGRDLSEQACKGSYIPYLLQIMGHPHDLIDALRVWHAPGERPKLRIDALIEEGIPRAALGIVQLSLVSEALSSARRAREVTILL